jgi:hypothetical protein
MKRRKQSPFLMAQTVQKLLRKRGVVDLHFSLKPEARLRPRQEVLNQVTRLLSSHLNGESRKVAQKHLETL